MENVFTDTYLKISIFALLYSVIIHFKLNRHVIINTILLDIHNKYMIFYGDLKVSPDLTDRSDGYIK
jgi:hypothetical protein